MSEVAVAELVIIHQEHIIMVVEKTLRLGHVADSFIGIEVEDVPMCPKDFNAFCQPYTPNYHKGYKHLIIIKN